MKTTEESMVDILRVKSKLYEMLGEYGELESITAMGEVIKDIRDKRKYADKDITPIDDVVLKIIDE